MNCTTHGCHNSANPVYQNFCSRQHLKDFAWRDVDPKITKTPKGKRVFFYDKTTHGKNYEFSNFFPKSVHYHGVKYKTAEHAYQAEKFRYRSSNPKVAQVYQKIKNANTPRKAAAIAGKNISLVNPKWHNKGSSPYPKKDRVMFDIVKDKFTRHPNLTRKLLKTKHYRLVEDSKVDSYWGRGANGQGENKLGRILQDVRAGIQSGKYKTN